jgi:RNA polymerase sigma factor (sigma-70 family)
MGIPPRTCGQDNAVAVSWPEDFVVLYRSSYRPMVRVAYLMLGSRAEAEEAVQDAMLAVHRRWGEVADPGSYLRRAVVNRAIGILRRRSVADRHVPDPPPPEEPAHLVELRDLLLALPERQRAAIVLRFVEDAPDRAIAVTLRCREATVRSLVARGLKTLREEVRHG